MRVGDERLDQFVARAATVTDGAGLASLTGFAQYVRADVEVSLAGRGTFGLYRVPVGRPLPPHLPGRRTADVRGGGRGRDARGRGARGGAGVPRGASPRGWPRCSTPPHRRARRLLAVGDVRVDAPSGSPTAAGQVTLDVGDAEPEVWVLHPDYLVYGTRPPSRRRPGRRTVAPEDRAAGLAPRGRVAGRAVARDRGAGDRRRSSRPARGRRGRRGGGRRGPRSRAHVGRSGVRRARARATPSGRRGSSVGAATRWGSAGDG